MTIKFKPFLIQCLTNLHVGSGDENYGVVDKVVQRDPTTNYPTIHSSSLKGALREHFEGITDKEYVDRVFGKEAEGGEETATGSFKFLNADLVVIPVRTNYKQYALTSTPPLIKALNEKSQLLCDRILFNPTERNEDVYYGLAPASYKVIAEEFPLVAQPHRSFLENDVDFGVYSFKSHALLKDADDEGDSHFSEVCRSLPVIARNKLENRKSKNLWYEEVIPHQTIFLTFVGGPEKELDDFIDKLKKEPVQIGANASIGYGLCKFYDLIEA